MYKRKDRDNNNQLWTLEPAPGQVHQQPQQPAYGHQQQQEHTGGNVPYYPPPSGGGYQQQGQTGGNVPYYPPPSGYGAPDDQYRR